MPTRWSTSRPSAPCRRVFTTSPCARTGTTAPTAPRTCRSRWSTATPAASSAAARPAAGPAAAGWRWLRSRGSWHGGGAELVLELGPITGQLGLIHRSTGRRLRQRRAHRVRVSGLAEAKEPAGHLVAVPGPAVGAAGQELDPGARRAGRVAVLRQPLAEQEDEPSVARARRARLAGQRDRLVAVAGGGRCGRGGDQLIHVARLSRRARDLAGTGARALRIAGHGQRPDRRQPVARLRRRRS